MKTTASILATALLMFVAVQSEAATGFTARGGTLGIGLEVTQSVVPKVNVRFGVNFFKYDYDTTKDDIRYDFGLRLRSVNIFGDVHPLPAFFSGLRLSAGLLYSKNRVDMVALPSGTYEIGGQTYTSADVGTLTGKVDLKDWPLYLGIGWGNAASGVIGIAFDVGVAFSGSPNIDLNTTGLLSNDASFRQELAREQTDLEDELSVFKVYPNLSLGLSLHIPGL
jgi:hypothetical protein